ncbi:MAG: beta-ketoacyl synthase chain length factor [Tannerella sp.]|jgi:3-oxoacyl-(acyl-carrier-protein) synthase|nr:beta-ketoacyl synthase chain length factor [Tannerella sp.]
MPVYIQSSNQISVQKPFSDEWFYDPVYYSGKRVASIDVRFADYLSPLMSRRMCALLKRAVVASRKTLKDAGIETPDAIISGTGLGCIDNTEKFLVSMLENGEKTLQPSYFMQSTHNVVSSTVAIDLKCHGYNNSFVHRGVSFEHALLDAMMQFARKRINNALVGGFDELTDNYYNMFGKIGMYNFATDDSPKMKCFASEAAVSMALSAEKTEKTLCEVNGVELMYRPACDRIREALDRMLAGAGCGLSDVDAVITGINTNAADDEVYFRVAENVFACRPVVQYKHIFGESFSSSAMAVHVAATCLDKGSIPSFLVSDRFAGAPTGDITGVKRILLYNHHKNKSHSLILLSSC